MPPLYFFATLALVVVACTRAPQASPVDSSGAASSDSRASSAVLAAQEIERTFLLVPPDSEIPAGPLGASIRRGRAIFEATRDSLPANVGNELRCLSCHLDGGRRANASPLVGSFLSYPAYNTRAARIYTIQDRINDCFRRSMAGRPLPSESAALRDMVSYLAFLSRGLTSGSSMEGDGIPKIRPLDPDTAHGREIFATTCARCHGSNGEGKSFAPPVWGPGSYSIGAGMARLRTAASFIRHNMPYDLPGTLTDQQAFDVAAYVNSHSRPDLAGKENDWPNGDAPPDAAYPTRASRRRGEVAMRGR
jgi:thiosulfate dehydrogenase